MGKKKSHNNAPPIVEKPTEDISVVADEPVEVEAIVDGVNMSLNIRKNPELKEGNQIAVLKKGTKIIVVDAKKPVKNKDGEWYKIRIFDKEKDEKEGYAMKKYIRIL